MSLFEQLTFGSIVHNGTPICAPAMSPQRVEAARNRTLYRATLTADRLDRRDVMELASWTADGGIRIVPGIGAGDDPLLPGMAFDFDTYEDAAGFLREVVVPRLLVGDFDAEIEAALTGIKVEPSQIPVPEPAYAVAAE